jgi:phosphoglycerate kinase
MDKMTVRDIEVSGKRVLVRVDFNISLDEATGVITDDSRIQATLPTIKYLVDRGAKTILCSHLGQPMGKVVEKLRMTPVAKHLSHLLGQEAKVVGNCIGPDVEKAVKELKNGEVLILENLRFHPEEEGNVDAFAQALSRLADIYVNDAFGISHRTHASTVGITNYLPAVAGLLVENEINTLGGILKNPIHPFAALQKEINTMDGILEDPVHPFAALLGGAKVSDKVGLITHIMDKVDYLLIGGSMAATFLKAKSHETGQSLTEVTMLDIAVNLMEKASRKGVRLLLPTDVIVVDEIGAKAKTVSIKNISVNSRITDIGPQTIRNFSQELKRCQTIFWNGPMGIYEIPRFAKGTISMAKLIAGLDAVTIIGGASTVGIVTEIKLTKRMSFISTGGGALLSYLGGRALPGLQLLLEKN